MKHPSLKISRHGNSLVAEWDNREIPRSWFTTLFFAVFWIVWVPLTIFVTYLLFSDNGPRLLFFIWLLFGYAGVFLIPMTWLLRHMKERIEIGNKLYQHYFVNLPWWFPKQWDADEITQIDFGNYNYESITTLNVRRGRKRDMIAYWAKSDFRKMLFEKIRTHLDEIDSNIPVVNLNAE